ncbi:hypothetical protein GCM10010401_01080 [Rarobacter faecitabidus]|uniref:Uncharacterized protein YndB with AHSA1/START domain n=1 Tax=Rarobacter faecitabidus TaxID=13243 RepID=A0A542ZWL7_RARFA|nr:SRPBCC family protein [Rarobacter faecitabidus]TQL64755.1 uncharacterized protein YndB with AHSA1/START domain [Rarobacter faecitabidus]
MPITSVTKDPEKVTLTVVADFAVPVTRLWDAYVDPRQIEKFWGPPQWPATFTRHDVAPGGRSDYYMTGPDGEESHGYWKFLTVTDGESFEVEDGFATNDGEPKTDMPSMRMTFSFEATPQGSRLTTITYFNSAEELEKLLAMGMQEGMTAAMGQIDDILADLTSYAASLATSHQLLSDTKVRISRIIRGSVEQIWKAHHEPALLRRWLKGPDGWEMSDCQVATTPGEHYRYAWRQEGGNAGFALIGELLAAEPPYRAVTTESMEGAPGPATLNELTLAPVSEGTLLTFVITYDNAEMRDMILDTGMVSGMEASYARLESEVLGS